MGNLFTKTKTFYNTMFRTSAIVIAALLATTEAVRLESMVMKGSGKGGEDGEKPEWDGEKGDGEKPEWDGEKDGEKKGGSGKGGEKDGEKGEKPAKGDGEKPAKELAQK